MPVDLAIPQAPSQRPRNQSLSPNISLGERTILLPSCSYEEYPQRGERVRVQIGSDCMIGNRFVFESMQGAIRVGDRTYISPGTSIVSRSQVTIGSDVMISWQVQIMDHDAHSQDWRDRRADVLQQNDDFRAGRDFRTNHKWSNVEVAPICIHDKVWIGFGAVILKGVTIGEGAIIGAHSVVTRDIDPWTVWAGNPARLVKGLDKPTD